MATFPTGMVSLIERSRSEKTRHEREWSAATKMLRGDQWLYWDTSRDRYRAQDRRPGEVRVTINQMLNIERSIIARLTINVPSPAVLPASDNADDITKAIASEMALRYFWMTDRQSRKWATAIRWLCQAGNAVLHCYFDPDHDLKHGLDESPSGGSENYDGPKEDRVVGSKKVRGRVTCDVISPYDVFWEPGVNDPEEARWVALRTYATKPELKDLYPEKKEQIEEASPADGYEKRSYQTYKPDGRLEVYEVYWRDGRHAIMLGDVYLQKEVSEDVRLAFPVKMLRYHTIEGDLWGQGPMVQIADLQQLYNRTRTQIHANVRLMGNPPWLIPRTADVRKGTLMNKPGAVIRYTPGGGPPHPAAPQQMPSHVLREPSVLREEMSDVAGAHGVTLGRREPGVKSGVHARTLTQQDATQLLSTQQEIVAGIEDMMTTVLMLMKRHYTETRVIRMLDHAGAPAWSALSRTNIVEDPEIHIDATSLFKVDAAAREARVLELVQLGLMTPEDAQEAISFRTYNKYITTKLTALSHARDMLQVLIMGGEIEVLETDDLEAFMKVFNEFMQSVEFYDLEDEIQDSIASVLDSVLMMGKPDAEYDAKRARGNVVHPRKRMPVSEAPQLRNVAQPAPAQPPPDPLADVPFPTEGQNAPGVPSAISMMQGGGQ